MGCISTSHLKMLPSRTFLDFLMPIHHRADMKCVRIECVRNVILKLCFFINDSSNDPGT